MNTISDLGEFGLISKIKGWVKVGDERVVQGIGDDTAVLKYTEDKYLLFTCDVQVDGIHFLRNIINPVQLGQKSLAINVSDIASMGGRPTFALISLLLPKEMEVDYLKEFYKGLQKEANKWNINLVGGNISKIEGSFVVDISLLGEVNIENLKLRSGAKPGDLIMVTGEPGCSAAGLGLLLKGLDSEFSGLIDKHLTPTPKLTEAQLIASFKGVTSMIDISDGFLKDLGHILEESMVGAILYENNLPISEKLVRASKLLNDDPLNFFLNGGEDYELIFTVKPGEAILIRDKVESLTGTKVSIVGKINSSKETILEKKDGVKKKLYSGGWDHFKKSS